MIRVFTQKQQNITLFILAAALFIYTTLRAALLSITWDEAYTYIEFVRNGVVLQDKYEMMSANNHILNTLGMIIFSKWFGMNELALRFPNVIAHFFFLFYSAKLLKKIDQPLLVVCGFVILNVNPYMLDFFCLARGYGLSLGMMMGSIYYFYLFTSVESNAKNSFLSMLFASLAVLSNFVLLNYCIVLFGLIFLFLGFNAYIKKQGKVGWSSLFLKEIAPSFMLFIGLLAFALPITFKLKEAGALFFGGERGFWADTISTITDRIFYEQGYSYWLQRLAKGFMFLVLITATMLVVRTQIKRETHGKALFLTSLVIMIGLCSLSTILQHHLMKTPYLLDRTVLFLVVLFNLILVFLLAELVQRKRQFIFLAIGSSVVLLLHFVFTVNIHYVLEWKYDADTKEMLSDLDQVKQIPNGKETVSIGIPLTFDPGINFYREKENLLWLNTAWRNETYNMCHDYFYWTAEEAKEHKDSIDIIKSYPGLGNVLAKRKHPVKEINKIVGLTNITGVPFEFNEKVEYGPAFSMIVRDSLMPQKRGVIQFSTNVKVKDLHEQNLIMVISFQNPKAEVYSWQKAYLKDFIKENDRWFHAVFSCTVPPEIHAGDEIKAYIWNPEKQALFIRRQEFRWLSYKF